MTQPQTPAKPEIPGLDHPYALSAERVLSLLSTTPTGLGNGEAADRQQRFGPNALPRKTPPGLFEYFFSQFKSPLIYVLVIAALVSLLIGEYSDAVFIAAVLLLNALIGTTQEFSAQRSAEGLQKMMMTQARVLRDGEAYQLDSREIVPGDIVLLESGDKVPADLRLLDSHNLEIDESLLTGESLAVVKTAATVLDEATVLGDRANMVFGGTIATYGRGRAVVVGTGMNTQFGRIARMLQSVESGKTPLQQNLDRVGRILALAALSTRCLSLLRRISNFLDCMKLPDTPRFR